MAEATTETEVTASEPKQDSLPAPETNEAATDQKAPTPKKKKVKRSVPAGQVHVMATFNNTIITITDISGGVLAASSAGACGFRGSKKGTAYAAQVAAEKAINTAKQQYGLSKADVFIKGIGLGREAAVRVLVTANVAVDSIKDVTGIPHGGTRPKKARRV
jgi:small subunit ribosomal protein S11